MNGESAQVPRDALSELGHRMNDIAGLADPASRIREYGRLVGEYPGSSLAAFNLALDLWRSGRRTEALDAARRAIAIAPELVVRLPSELVTSLRAAARSTDTASDRLGEIVAGFRITHRIAEDPRTLFYRVERGTEQGYLRVLHRSLSQDPQVATRFIESARLLQCNPGPGLVTIREAGMLADGCAYVLMQPAPGTLLSERIWSKEPLAPLAPALGMLAEGLAALHAQGLCYLGIQPERIQVAAGAAPALQLLDSEHVRGPVLQLPAPTIAGGPVREGVDPVLFMAPELFSGRAEVGPPADVYALGVLAYYVLCGHLPFQAESIGEVIAAHLNRAPSPLRSAAPGVPEELGRLVDAMLDKDPGRRPAMAHVAEAWAQIFSEQVAPETFAAPPPSAPTVGDVLGEHRLVRKLGEGRTGEVFEAYNERLRRRDAIKVIRAELCRSPEDEERFLREVQAANQVAHPGIVSIIQQARAPSGQIYTVMELVGGESLRDRIQRGPMPAEQVQRLCRHVALAIAAAHEHGVIHRDLKPENVLVVPDPAVDGGERTKIVDFGTANLTESPFRGGPYVEGTPAYMSPEQLSDTRTAGTKTDVFALGIMMSEMLAGGLRPGAPSVPADCPPWLSELIRRMQDANPGERPTMQEVADLLSASREPHANASRAGGDGMRPDDLAEQQRRHMADQRRQMEQQRQQMEHLRRAQMDYAVQRKRREEEERQARTVRDAGWRARPDLPPRATRPAPIAATARPASPLWRWIARALLVGAVVGAGILADNQPLVVVVVAIIAIVLLVALGRRRLMCEGVATQVANVPGSGNAPHALTFRLERGGDGDQVELVPVELRGGRVVGQLLDGDEVRIVHQGIRDGMLRARRIYNLRTGQIVRTRPRVGHWIGIAVAWSVLAIILTWIVLAVTRCQVR
jgi:serine/threonine protein kinase